MHRHRGRQTDGQAGGSAIEPVLPMVRLVDGQERVSLVEPDGHAMWTVDLGGTDDTFEVLGVYGMPVAHQGVCRARNELGGSPPVSVKAGAASCCRASGSPGAIRTIGRFAPPSPWPIDGYHGIERADRYDVAHFGARHMVLRDGLWMQPEPLLYLGLQQVDLSNPAAYGPLYAAGRPTELTDPSGFAAFAQEADLWTQIVRDVNEATGGGTVMAGDPRGVAVAVAVPVGRTLVTRACAWAAPLLASASEMLTPTAVTASAVGTAALAQPTTMASEGGGDAQGKGQSQAGRQKGDRMTTGSAAEADQQLEEIESAQSRVRQGKSKQIIDSAKRANSGHTIAEDGFGTSTMPSRSTRTSRISQMSTHMNEQELRDQFDRAVALRDQGQYREAADLLLEALRGDLPQRYRAAVTGFLAGVLLYNLEQPAEAESFCRASVSLSPRSELASLALFHALWSLGRPLPAFREMRRFLNVYGESAEYEDVADEIASGMSAPSAAKAGIRAFVAGGPRSEYQAMLDEVSSAFGHGESKDPE